MNKQQLNIKELIKDIPDFPQKGIIFRDITTLLNNDRGIILIQNEINDSINYHLTFNKVVAIEARGFIIGSLLVTKKIRPLVLARKPGKLPNEILQKKYSSEYADDTICIQLSDISRSDNIIVVDDVLATGRTAKTTCEIIETLGGRIEACYFLIELDQLRGREKLERLGINVISSIHY